MTDATIVYVHGNGNKARKELLKSQWDRALFGTDMGTASRMAYWAPLRYGDPLPDDEPDPLAGGPVPLEELPDLGAARTPEEFIEVTLAEARLESGPLPEGPAAGGRSVEDRSAEDRSAEGRSAEGRSAEGRSAETGEERLAGWLAKMTYSAETLGRSPDAISGPASADLREALPLPGFLRTPVFELLVGLTFKDVHAYFFGGVGEAMRDVVRGELAEVGAGPLVVVGHSLGSVIAYEVLREARRDVSLFVTVGSPLGITEIQDLLAHPTAVPAGVAAWSNASDLRDLVALDHSLRPEYGPPSLVTDHLVRNDSGNHHGIRQYLACEPVRSQVTALFGRLATGGGR
ncbi:lipase family protein [Streptomyces sp. NBC_01351]|uniref:hypothetical protein n=1 Tax=Streptomyces sp. NBC_01351 TaxID=2903833 RepID=UPI002E30ECC8|nr:hypothetical protein [Streptomyces sp. NBC_01351]